LHILTAILNNPSRFSHYLPLETNALHWGMHVKDAGNTEVPVDSPYPPGLHPDEYNLTWSSGRRLQEYQLIYITRGRGVFETAETGMIRVKAGQVILLFPRVWHRYRPLKKTGWDESWIGFGGDVADRIMGSFFSTDKAVVSIGYDQELKNLILSVAELTRETPPGFQQLMAARTIEALAIVRSLSMSYHSADLEADRKIQQVRYHLLQYSQQDIKMEDLAKDLGLSYSRFRALFKSHTGVSPQQYLISIRINKASELLRHTDLSIAEISERTGFASSYYFSRLFKQKTGYSPSAYKASEG